MVKPVTEWTDGVPDKTKVQYVNERNNCANSGPAGRIEWRRESDAHARGMPSGVTRSVKAELAVDGESDNRARPPVWWQCMIQLPWNVALRLQLLSAAAELTSEHLGLTKDLVQAKRLSWAQTDGRGLVTVISLERAAYLRMDEQGEQADCLLDRGSEVGLFLGRYTNRAAFISNRQRLYAANSTEIATAG